MDTLGLDLERRVIYSIALKRALHLANNQLKQKNFGHTTRLQTQPVSGCGILSADVPTHICFEASMMRSEATSDAEDIETTTTAPVSPTFSEEELPMPTRKPNDYKIFIRIHKNVTTTPAVVFKVKANQTVQSVFNRACTYFDFHPSL